jgi:hypothetical protein
MDNRFIKRHSDLISGYLLLKWVLPICLLFFLSCEKYISYSYEAGSIASKANVTGAVYDKHQKIRVGNAEISFNGVTTTSDKDGFYNLEYILGVDEQRDKPVNVLVTAPNYLPLDTGIVFYPGPRDLDLVMEYGAPRIQKIWMGVTNGKVEVQVQVRDFQGIDNIDYIRSKSYYHKMHENEVKSYTAFMNFIMPDTLLPNSYFFRSTAPIMVDDGWYFELRQFEVEAVDHDGFNHLVDKKYADIWSTEPLF